MLGLKTTTSGTLYASSCDIRWRDDIVLEIIRLNKRRELMTLVCACMSSAVSIWPDCEWASGSASSHGSNKLYVAVHSIDKAESYYRDRRSVSIALV
jgi:hypothetical protein